MDINQWHHFAFIKEGPIKKIYVDGVLAIAGEGTAPLPTDFTELIIGGSNVVGSVDGCLDDFAVFAGALTDQNIMNLFTRTKTPLEIDDPIISLASWKAANAPGQTIDDDADGDGLTTFWEYAAGGTAGANDSGHLPVLAFETLTVEGSQAIYPTITAIIRSGASDLQLFPESSSSHAAAGWSSSDMIFVRRTDNGDGTDTMSWRYARPSGTDPSVVFMRLRAVLP